MSWQTLLTNEAVSNYLVFGSGLLVGFLIHILRKIIRKPSIVKLERQKEVSLLELDNEAKDRLKITYQDQPVNEFHLTLFELRNKSGNMIEDITLKLFLDDENGKQKLYEMIFDDPLEDIRQPPPEVKCVYQESGEHFLLITVPYLNDSKNHKDSLTLRVYSPKPIKVKRLVGGGKGWMSEFFDRVAFNQKLDRIVRESNSTMELVLNTGVASMLRRWR